MKTLLQKIFWPVFAFVSVITLWTALAFSQANTWPDFRGNMLGVPSGLSSGGTVTGPICFDMGSDAGVCCYDNDQAPTCSYRTNDANASNAVMNPEDVWPFAALARTPGDYYVRGGIDSKTFNVIDGFAGCTGADYARAVYTADGTSTTTTCTYSVDWCSGVGADTCATTAAAAVRLAVCLDAGVGIGATTSGATCPGGAANDRCVGVYAGSKTSTILLSQNDATCTIMDNGTDGVVRADRAIAAPYIYGGVGLCGSSTGVACTGTTFNLAVNGKPLITTAAGIGIGFDVTTANRLSLMDQTGVTVGEYADLLVGTVAAVDMSSVARQVLYTVPAGKTFYPRLVSIGPCSAVIDTAEGGLGSNTPANDFFAASLMTHTAAASIAWWRPAAGVAVPSIAAAGDFAYDGTVAEGAADTCTMSVYGVLR